MNTNYKYLPTVSMKLADTITMLEDDIFILDTSDPTGETLTSTGTVDLGAFWFAKENGGSATAGENAGKYYEFYSAGPIALVNTAAAVTINTLAGSSTTAKKAGAGTGSAGDYSIGIYVETTSAAGKARVMLMPCIS